MSVKEAGFENKQAYQTRVDRLGGIAAWGLAGKISLDDGDQGGSGRFQWDVDLAGKLKAGENMIALRVDSRHHQAGMFRRPGI